MLKILVAEHDYVFREGLKSLLIKSEQYNIVAEVANRCDLLKSLAVEPVDILLLDLDMGASSCKSLICQIKETAPGIRILGITNADDVLYIAQLIRVGLKGIVRKDCEIDEFLCAVTRVSSGLPYMNDAIAEKLFAYMTNNNKLPHEELTRRELDVYTRLVKGGKGKHIANDLCISEKTVSAHKRRLLQKMGFKNMSDLIRYSISQHVV